LSLPDPDNGSFVGHDSNHNNIVRR
jgi:hypothetical protein